jgi:NodT family efflux transporter outer membrane factor (OMF) lipoprotein
MAQTRRVSVLVASFAVAAIACGCTSLREFVQNGFKVGPDYQRPPAPLADNWIEAKNPKVKSVPADYSAWWGVFKDPVLNDLVKTAYAQNVNLRIAGTRVLEARAQQAIAVGALFPQEQQASGSYAHVQTSGNAANVDPHRFFNNWATGFNATWEIDFWGKIRRTIESTDDLVDASIDDYDNVMVSLIGDLATAYVQYRIFEQQRVYARQNVEIQKESLKIATARFKAGQTNELSVLQANSLLEQLESTIPVIEIAKRQASNAICVLLGMPPEDLAAKLGEKPIPDSPPEVIVGIPADLIRRRPDLRAAERIIAAQNAQIGVADAGFYPAFFISGTIGYQSKDLGNLFTSKSFTGQIGPGFQWDILNYGRILNNVRLQDFKTQELVGIYQQKVLSAAQEVENNLITYLNARREAAHLAVSVKDAERTVKIATDLFTNGAIDYTAVFVAQQFQAQQQNLLALAEGNVALGLIGVYRALGGGWEYRLTEEAARTDAPVNGGTECANAPAAPAIREESQTSAPPKEAEAAGFASSRADQEIGSALRRRDVAVKRRPVVLPDQ